MTKTAALLTAVDQQPTSTSKKTVGKPFQKGVSGNPTGRPKIAGEIRTLAQSHGPDAFKKVLELMASEDERVSLAAAQEVLNRAYGKAAQSVDMTVGKKDVADITDAELADLARSGSKGASEKETGPRGADPVH